MSNLEDWFAEDPKRKWLVGIGFCFFLVAMVLFFKAGPEGT